MFVFCRLPARLAEGSFRSAESSSDGGNKGTRVGLADHAIDSCSSGQRFEGFGLEKRIDDDRHIGQERTNLPSGRDSIHLRHHHVENNDIGMECFGLFNRGLSVFGFAADFPRFMA